MKSGTKDIYMYVLGAIIVIGFFVIIYVVFNYSMPEANKDIGLILLGVLGAKFGDVVGYFFGSSKSSSDKQDLLNSKNV